VDRHFPDPEGPVSIYEKVGGADALRTAVVTFYDKVVADPELAPYFESVDLARLRGHQQSFLISALGGPDYYGGRDLRSAHHGLGVSDGAFDRIVEHLRASLEVVGVDEGVISQVLQRVEAQRPVVVETEEGA
jgi:hemoglobin